MLFIFFLLKSQIEKNKDFNNKLEIKESIITNLEKEINYIISLKPKYDYNEIKERNKIYNLYVKYYFYFLRII